MKVFLDANIILDLIDLDRGNFEKTKSLISELLLKRASFYTSCDIFTTVFYVANKRQDYLKVIKELEKILAFVNIIAIDIDIIKKSMQISKEKKVSDLEDILQYICAKEAECDLILTNDKNFYSEDIKVVGTK